MALQKAEISIPLGGENRKIDAAHAQKKALLRVENAVFRKPGALTKRPGYILVGNATVDGGTHQAPKRIMAHAGHLLFADDRYIYEHDLTSGKSAKRGPSPKLLVSAMPVVRPAEHTDKAWEVPQGVAYANGYIVVVSIQDFPGFTNCIYRVYRESSRQLVLSGLFNVFPSTPVVPVGMGNFLRLFYAAPVGTFEYLTIDTSTLTTSTTAAWISNVAGNSWTAVPVSGSSDFIFAYKDSATGLLTATRYNSAVVPQNSGTATEAGTVTGMHAHAVNAETCYLIYKIAGATRSAGFTLPGMAAAYAPLNIDGTNAPDRSGIVRISSTKAGWLYDYLNAGKRELKYGTITSVGVVDTSVGVIKRLELAAQPVAHDGKAIMLTRYDASATAADDTYYEHEFTDENFAARKDSSNVALPVLLGTHHRFVASASAAVPVAEPETGRFLTVVGVTASRDMVGFDGVKTSAQGLDVLELDMRGGASVDRRFASAPWGSDLFIAGAQPHIYDGRQNRDSGHTMRPDLDQATFSIVVGGNLGQNGIAATTYKWAFVWEYSGRRIHQSAPSVSATLQVAKAPDANRTAQFDIPPYIPGNRQDDTIPVQCAIYRTQADGSILYYLKSVDPDKTALTDGDDDSKLDLSRPLYTESGELPNIGPPACKVVALHDDRMFAAGLERPNVIAFSKPYAEGLAPDFVLAGGIGLGQEIQLPTEREITALASSDAVLLAFTSRAIFAITGDGPAVTGVGPEYRVQIVSTEVGTADWRSLVKHDDGWLFQSAKGLYLITRGLSVQPVPDVERAIAAPHATIVGGVLRDKYTEIKLALNGLTGTAGKLLHFDYVVEQWGEDIVDSNAAEIQCMAEYGGELFFGAGGSLFREQSNIFTDDGVAHVLAIEGRVALNTLVGWQRIRRIGVQGRYSSAHGLVMRYRHNAVEDTVSAWDQSITRTEAQMLTSKYPVLFGPKQQTAHNTHFRLEEVAGAEAGAGAEWVDVVVHGGVKRGMAKLPETSRS